MAMQLGDFECFLCGKEVKEEAYCFGCQKFICKECNENPDCCGDHKPEDHRKEIDE